MRPKPTYLPNLKLQGALGAVVPLRGHIGGKRPLILKIQKVSDI